MEDLKEKVRSATILGTLQSGLSDYRYLRKVWTDNQEEERLLGVSLTGIMDHPVMSGNDRMFLFHGHEILTSQEQADLYNHFIPHSIKFKVGDKVFDPIVLRLPEVLTYLKAVASDTNAEVADLMGIPRSKQLTLVKPSGTVSQLCGTSSGIHPRFAPYYFRRVTQDIKDPLTDLMIDEGIPHVIKNQKAVFSFPVKSPDHAICAKEMGAMAQLELWLTYKEYWCDGNPSQTIYYTDDEFLDVQKWVWDHWDSIGGLSFFPLDDNIYDKDTQPYLEITKEEYEEALKVFPKDIDWSRLPEFETEDATTSLQEFACAGGACEL